MLNIKHLNKKKYKKDIAMDLRYSRSKLFVLNEALFYSVYNLNVVRNHVFIGIYKETEQLVESICARH